MDLAIRGALLRTVGCGLFLGGAGAWGAGFESDIGRGGTVLIILGGLGAIATAVSLVYDLAVIPDATKNARAHRVSVGVRSDGVVVVSLHY